MTDKAIRQAMKRIQSEPICEPADGEFVDSCPWSRTGYAIWNRDGGCSCRPALAPPGAAKYDTASGEYEW